MDLRQPPAGPLSWPEPKEIMKVKEGAKGIPQKYEDFRNNNSWYGPRRLVTRIVIILTMGHEKWSYWLFL